MFAPTANRERPRLFLDLAGAILLLAAADVGAQQHGFMAQPTQVEFTVPIADVVSGANAARLEQAHQLVAAGNWDGACEIWRELIAENTRRVVALDNNRYISLSRYCHLQIARLPPAGLVAYRHQVDESAEKLYREGIANRDEQLLRVLVNEHFCSNWGDDALLALGDSALERGDCVTARIAWEQISPLLEAPDGSSMFCALRDIDLKLKWPEVEARWQNRKTPADWPAYPDTQLDLAEIRARLVLASIRANEFDRAKLELEVFERLHPGSVGHLGGQQVNLAAALRRLMAAAHQWRPAPAQPDWPTFSGTHARSTIAAALSRELVPKWREPVSIIPPEDVRFVPVAQGGAGDDATKRGPDATTRESQRPLSCYPIITGEVIVFADGVGIHAVDLATGKPTITPAGLLDRSEGTNDRGRPVALGVSEGITHGVPRLTLDSADQTIYARIGTFSTSSARAGDATPTDRIIGLDLRREGLLSFRAIHTDDGWTFDGTPTSDGHRVWIAMRRNDVVHHAYVACFDAATGVQQWQTAIGSGETIAGGAKEITHNLLTLVENRVYINTNLGLVAALDADSGKLIWISRYDRLKGKTFTIGAGVPLHFDRDPAPCVYADGLLFVAPADTPAILAIDTNSGKILWKQEQLTDTLQLLGVVGRHLIASGNRLTAVDIVSGHIDWVWPESDRAGIRGMGRGVVAGDEIFWPTRNAILAVDPKTGEQTRAAISVSPVNGGANLAVAHGNIIVAGFDKLIVLGPPDSRTVDALRTDGRNRNGISSQR